MSDSRFPTTAEASVPASPQRILCIVLHDVAPGTWGACQRLLAALEGIAPNTPVTHLAVPRYHNQPRDSEFEAWLQARAQCGDEIALHGFTHLDERPSRGPIDHLRRRHYTRSEGEFSDLSYHEASERIDAGMQWLDELGIEAKGFVAPAWLLGEAAWRALRAQQRFDYTCTLRHIHLLPGEQRITAQAQVWSNSAAWRRDLSVLWNATLAARQRAQPVVRLELHPADIDHPVLARSWMGLAREQLQSRRSQTLHQVVSQLAAS